MTSAETHSRTATDPERSRFPRAGEGFIDVPKLAAEAETVGAFVRRSLVAVREHFNGPLASISVRFGAQSLNDEATDGEHDPKVWRPAVQPLLMVAQAEGQSIARLYRASATDELVAVAACPLPPSASELSGALAVCALAKSEVDLPGLLAELRGLAALLAHLSGVIEHVGSGSEGSSGASAGDAATDAVARANDYRSTTQLAFAITNSLRSRFDCEQVAMGLVRASNVRLTSISGLDDVKARSPGTVRIRQAMEECFDAKRDVLYQIEDGWDEAASVETRYRLHKQWHDQTGGAAVLSVPLVIDGRCIAVVSLRRRANRPFSRAEITKLRSLLEPFAPALLVVARASRGVVKTALDRAAEAVAWAGSPRALGRKLALVLLLAGAGFFCFGTMPYDIATRATVAAAGASHVVAPYEAPIAEAFVREGDEVAVGAALVRFDTREFELHREQLLAEGGVLRAELEQAIAAGEIEKAALADARLNVIAARLAQVEARLDRAVLRAPRAGMVMRGDLGKRVGQVVPQGEPLFEIASPDDLRLDLRVPEGSIGHVSPEQAATFTWIARPESPTAVRIERIDPTATPIEKRNVFRARAAIEGETPTWLRPGMEGHADVHAGRKPVWWIVLHRAIDAARMELWL